MTEELAFSAAAVIVLALAMFVGFLLAHLSQRASRPRYSLDYYHRSPRPDLRNAAQ